MKRHKKPQHAYRPGDKAVLFVPYSDYHLSEVSIVKGFETHIAMGLDGKPQVVVGYIVNADGKEHFAFAHQLRDRPSKPSHLRLVVDNDSPKPLTDRRITKLRDRLGRGKR